MSTVHVIAFMSAMALMIENEKDQSIKRYLLNIFMPVTYVAVLIPLILWGMISSPFLAIRNIGGMALLFVIILMIYLIQSHMEIRRFWKNHESPLQKGP